jgi:hypothetical protein
MITLNGKVVFERSDLTRGFSVNNTDPLKKVGAFIRKKGRSLLRKAKKPSKPGSPPRSRAKGHPLKLILFQVTTAKKGRKKSTSSVIVGPVGFGKSSVPVPGLHEHGAIRLQKVFKQTKRQTAYTATQRKAYRRLILQGRIKPKAREKVVMTTKIVRYKKRPFMKPALDDTKQKLPGMWKGSVKAK